ncbi:leucyl aminopeptidase family protein [Flavobacterium piscinae]|uniref:Leucyl aminopeptidase family protein n=1 Tax=Flavobacterium piscinae TaxID=2506424 RepID=A0A4Q1KU11_9FLAO|nr:leucyl aminopeptidase family protein [Flavobacterium piscinae]RXR32584.1 leucyl aminopeptidase family protein [Flavobacterium piscinae]
MKINYLQKVTSTENVILVPVLETDETVQFLSIAVSNEVFSGKKDSTYVIEKVGVIYLFVGLGKSPDFSSLKKIFRRVAHQKENFFKGETSLIIPDFFTDNSITAAINGLVLGTYRLGHYKKEKEKHPLLNEECILNIIATDNKENAVERGLKIANAQLETYHLVDLPPNKITPKQLADWAIEAGKKFGFSVEVFGQQKSKEIGLDAFISVGKGSANESQFIVMDYYPKNAKKHIGLVGKGITFDTGGLNIKTAGMVHMKCDMAGGAAVLGAMQLIADLQLPYRVTAIVPACENSVDANSFLPSDVIGSYSGHSIEIIDTDAEGRLILADGLSYLIKNYNPETVIDLATLTGSSVATFGNECGALFTNNEQLSKYLQEAGDGIGERLWPLPLWDAYKSDIESEIADVKNFSGKPVAGAISAAKFLEYFTENHTAWAHLDIAGVTFVDDEFAKTKHATAFGVHLLINFIENL